MSFNADLISAAFDPLKLCYSVKLNFLSVFFQSFSDVPARSSLVDVGDVGALLVQEISKMNPRNLVVSLRNDALCVQAERF